MPKRGLTVLPVRSLRNQQCLRSLTVTVLLCLSVIYAHAQISSDTLVTDGYIHSMQSGDYTGALKSAVALRSTAQMRQDLSLKMLADSYIGQSYLAMDEYDSAYVYLSESLSLWNGQDSLFSDESECQAVYAALNGLGIYSIVRDMNYEKAVEYFLQGLKLAEERSSYYHYAVLGSNLVYTFNLRQDTSGLAYAREIYRYGRMAGNDYLVFTGSSTSAMMFYLKGDLDSARRYAREAVRLADRYSDKAQVYALYGDILHDEGNDIEAEKYYVDALASAGTASTTAAVSIYLSYGNFLLDCGRYDEAVAVLDRGVRMSDSTNNHIFLHRLYLSESEAYSRQGEYRKAWELFKLYHYNSREVQDLQRERTLNELTRKYEKEKHERQKQQSDLTIIRKNRTLLVSGFVILLMLTVIGMVWMMYRHKNRLYVRIARQYKEAIDKEKAQKRRIEELEEKLKALSHEPSRPLTDKSGELFDRLGKLMQEDKVYKEKNLTRDKVAALLGTNRTYLSQIINEKTGMSFIYYINSFRIEEALETLSDPDEEIPLKALSQDLGFSSLTTFYTFFQKKVGMTPAKYREEVRRLSNSTNCQTR